MAMLRKIKRVAEDSNRSLTVGAAFFCSAEEKPTSKKNVGGIDLARG